MYNNHSFLCLLTFKLFGCHMYSVTHTKFWFSITWLRNKADDYADNVPEPGQQYTWSTSITIDSPWLVQILISIGAVYVKIGTLIVYFRLILYLYQSIYFLLYYFPPSAQQVTLINHLKTDSWFHVESKLICTSILVESWDKSLISF